MMRYTVKNRAPGTNKNWLQFYWNSNFIYYFDIYSEQPQKNHVGNTEGFTFLICKMTYRMYLFQNSNHYYFWVFWSKWRQTLQVHFFQSTKKPTLEVASFIHAGVIQTRITKYYGSSFYFKLLFLKIDGLDTGFRSYNVFVQ